MNLVDLLLVLIVALAAWGGWRRGVVRGTAGVLGVAFAVAAAFWGYRTVIVGAGAAGLDTGSVWALPLAFLACYVLARLLAGALLGRLADAVPERVHRHGLSRVLGVAPGALAGLVQASIVALLLLVVPLADRITLEARASRLADPLAGPASWLEEQLAPIFRPAVDRTLQRLTVSPGSTERVELPFRVAEPTPRPELEARLLVLVNEERARAGLPPLRADPEVRAVARAHARDMAARGYFSHVTPEGRGPFDRLRGAGVRFRAAGENLAIAPTLALAHQGLMNSPGHRANILRPSFGRVGIAVLDAGRHGLVVTQKFRD